MADEPKQPTEEEMMAQWEAMAGGEDGGGGDAASADGAVDARVLNQDEIDSLLGFDTKDEGNKLSGIYAILDKSLMAYEKLPMIEVVFDRMVRQLSTSLRLFTSDNIDVSLDSMTSLRFDDYLNSIPLPALLVVYRAVEWENFGMVTLDASLIYTMVDLLLGGRRTNKPVRVEGRPYTTIEQDLVKRLVDIVLADMSSAFEPLSPATFQFERLETNPRFATITRPANAALLVRLRVDVEERSGIVEILLPHATLEPIRDLLLQMFMGEKFGQDTVWEKHLGKELRHTDVSVEAILNEKEIILGDVMRFEVGSTILLDCMPDDDVILKCGGVTVSKGKLGRMGDHMAVAVSDPVSQRYKET